MDLVKLKYSKNLRPRIRPLHQNHENAKFKIQALKNTKRESINEQIWNDYKTSELQKEEKSFTKYIKENEEKHADHSKKSNYQLFCNTSKEDIISKDYFLENKLVNYSINLIYFTKILNLTEKNIIIMRFLIFFIFNNIFVNQS
ncbi:hypothetical protein BpHYR1_022740 [Brachionus plicatilis]|uniref:Uncharacterized protein n=1 Tax=Brachionus plicatilis TaxID=10195 RepID=A0A3M7PGG9_BRAPC|nr:hypothetical protein BpHYR1_022740 [Brachionus plicatilis]